MVPATPFPLRSEEGELQPRDEQDTLGSDSGAVTFELGPDDLTHAFQCQYIGQVLSRRYLLTQLGVAAVLLILSPWGLGPPGADPWFFVILIVAIGLVAPFIIWRWRLPRAAARNYAQAQGLRSAMHLRWNAEGLRFSTVNSDVLTPWSHYRRWREDDRTILLYQTDHAFQFIPKRVLTSESILQLRSLAAAAGIRGAAPS